MTPAPPSITTERVDDVPLLLAHLTRMQLPDILDACFPAHGNRQGLSLGWVATVWLTHILSQADHRLNQVRDWAAQLPATLAAALPQPLRPTDLTDDRLAAVLRALSDDAAWAACEAMLNQATVRAYALPTTVVRVDSTTISGYWEVSDDGLPQFGQSKDHRPDLPQFKVMLATLDPLGMPLAADVVPGQRADDQLYLPIIARVRASLDQTGVLYVGDGKLGALATRATLQQAGDWYLCPLRGAPPPDLLDPLVADPTQQVAVTAPGPDGTPTVVAHAAERAQTPTATLPAGPLTWAERWVLVHSPSWHDSEVAALERRLGRAEQALTSLLVPRRGKTRPATRTAAEQAIAAILAEADVADLLQVDLQVTTTTRTVGAYRDRPARTETDETLDLTVTRQDAAIGQARARLGWRVYATNAPAERLPLAAVVQTYRSEVLIEQQLGRLKGAPLSLRPVYLSRDDHLIGLTRLLTIALRGLCVLEHAVRTALAATPAPTLAGLYAGQPRRTTARPTAELLLTAFRHITLTVVRLPDQALRHLPPLSALQERILALARIDIACYHRLTAQSPEPDTEIRER